MPLLSIFTQFAEANRTLFHQYFGLGYNLHKSVIILKVLVWLLIATKLSSECTEGTGEKLLLAVTESNFTENLNLVSNPRQIASVNIRCTKG